MKQITWRSEGNGNYTVTGPGFTAQVHVHNGLCSVMTCSNVMVNAWDIALWCERNIR